MSFFKELNQLIKWLFASRPSDAVASSLTVEGMEHFPFEGYKYMMWCGRIITRRDKDATISEILHTEKGKVSYNHERIHAYQACYACNDSWVKYYWSYFVNWCKHNPLVHPSKAAYYCNKYEVEAYAQEGNLGYLKNYTCENLKGKYSIKKAKKLFKQLGYKAKNWKEYIKTL